MNWLIAPSYLLLVQILHYLLFSHGSSMLLVNTRASWGVPLPNWLLIIVSGLIIIGAIWLGARQKTSLPIPVLLIIASGLSNALDRVWYGGVIDYFDIGPWPVFNIPDAVLTVIIIYYLYKAFKLRGSRRSAPVAR